MDTILIAHRDVAFAEQLGSVLRNGGYRVIGCPGPWPPVERCIRCDVGYCPLTEGADLMIYDPWLTALNREGERCNLAPHVHDAAHEPAALVRQVRSLLAPVAEATAVRELSLASSR